jgi:outer membrane protein OmpA-like peptidoglycan-associated protein
MTKLYPLFFIIVCIGCNDTYNQGSNTIRSSFFNGVATEQNKVSLVKEVTNTTFQIKEAPGIVHPTKLSHDINTSASEYLPCPVGNTILVFSAMDRTGYFENKIDFTKTRKFGGEDVFIATTKNGLWEDAKPFGNLNTNYHETISQVLNNQDVLITGNYQENIGPTNTSNGSATTDIFFAKKKNNYQVIHFDEPINSLYTEADAFMNSSQELLLFVSDRPGHVGKYHKKGWLWNENYWGNTDVYVSFKEGDTWTVPKNLGPTINSIAAERSPFLSSDGLTLYLSSNGYKTGKNDLDIYFFKRTNKNDWEHWEGPFEIKGLNNPMTDDWGYKESENGTAYFSSANKLGFTPTKKGKDGTGFIFETNFRAGYEVLGLQTASFKKDEQTDIYFINKNNIAITLPDILFAVDSYKLNPGFLKLKDKIIDFIKINNPKKISINGYTDADGTAEHNMQLSLNRAKTIQQLIIDEFPNIAVSINGKGKDNPVVPNTSKENKQKNRRVEIIFE